MVKQTVFSLFSIYALSLCMKAYLCHCKKLYGLFTGKLNDPVLQSASLWLVFPPSACTGNRFNLKLDRIYLMRYGSFIQVKKKKNL